MISPFPHRRCTQKETMMTDPDPPLHELRQRALSRWDNEGGAVDAEAMAEHRDVPDMTNVELVLLRVRVIALENLLIAVLAEESDRQRQAALDMADAIMPREGFTQHPLTIRAAQHMSSLIERAERTRTA